MTAQYIQIGLQAVLIIVVIYLAFFKSYLKQKGKNLATKEDISGITREIEKVKSELQVTTKNEIDFKADQRKAVLEFYDSFVYWYEVVLELSNSNLDADRMKEIEQYGDRIDDAYKNVVINARRLELYISEDENLLECASRLVSAGLAVEGPTSKFLIKIHQIYCNSNEYDTMMANGVAVREEALAAVEDAEKKAWEKIYAEKEKMDEQVDDLMEHYIDAAKKYLRGF